MIRKKTLEERYQKIKGMKEVEVLKKENEYFFNSFPKTICPRIEFCPDCAMYLQGTCGGCDHPKCRAKSCGNWCEYETIDGKNLCESRYDRCGKMDSRWVEEDFNDLKTFSLEYIMGEMKPTKPLDLDTIFIPGVAPYGRNAPGEIVRHEDAFADLSSTDNICMVPSNQLPLYYPKADGSGWVDPKKIGVKKVDICRYLGVLPDTKILLNFRMKDFLLDYWWSRIAYDRDNSPYQVLFKTLKDLGIDYCVNINFSMWDQLSKYHAYYNMVRSWISFVGLQKYFDDVIMEFDYFKRIPEINEWYYEAIREIGISTIHLNMQLEETTEGTFQFPLRQNLAKKLECDEILLGGAGNIKSITKFNDIFRNKKVYVSHTRAYIGTVFKEHMSGRRWQEKFPGTEPEKDEARAFYYKNLFEENSRWFNDKLKKVMR